MKSKTLTIPSMWALACAAALAQTPPPADPPQEEEKTPPNLPKIELGYSSWGLRGNRSTFNRYATIPRGLFFKELSFGLYDASPALFGTFVLRGRPDEDYVFEGQTIFGPRATSLAISSDRAEFFQPSTVLIEGSRRTGAEGTLRQELSPSVDVVLEFRTSKVDKNFEGPGFPTHYKSNTFGGRIAKDLGKGQASVSFTDRHFYDQVNFQPDAHTQTWRGALSHPVGALELEGAYSQANISQVGWKDSRVKSWSLDGGYDLNPDLYLQFGFEGRKFELPNVLNAYVRERMTSFARLSGSFLGVNGDLSYKHVENERVREDHSYVDVPKFNTLQGRIYGRLNGGPRWTLKGTWENLDGDAVYLTEDPRRLIWDDQAKVQLRIEDGGENWSGYAGLSHRFFQNEMRDIEVRTNQLTMGGTYQHKPNLGFYGEVQYDFANTDFIEQGATIGLDSFFPSSRVFTMGTAWNIDPNNDLSASFTEITTDNDNPSGAPEGNIYSRFISAHWTHRAKNGNEFGLLIAPGRYADRIFRSLGYNATVVMVTAKWKF